MCSVRREIHGSSKGYVIGMKMVSTLKQLAVLIGAGLLIVVAPTILFCVYPWISDLRSPGEWHVTYGEVIRSPTGKFAAATVLITNRHASRANVAITGAPNEPMPDWALAFEWGTFSIREIAWESDTNLVVHAKDLTRGNAVKSLALPNPPVRITVALDE